MEIGMVGLGRMGAGMSERLLRGGHAVVAFDVSPGKVQETASRGAEPAQSLEELAEKLAAPRVVWMMVPAGEPVTQTIEQLAPHLASGDILIDGGNSYYKDSIRRAEELARKGIRFLDVGTSGGVSGLTQGYCLMVGGDAEASKIVEPAFRTLAPKQGYAHVGPSGAGHFVKMVHNGIEYGMLQAYGEGFELLKASRFDLNLHRIAQVWLHGSVVRSWLLELAESAFRGDPNLESIKGYVEDSGEGRWTVHEAIDSAVPIPAIADSLFARFRSRQDDSFSAKVIAALRREFGGHPVKREAHDVPPG